MKTTLKALIIVVVLILVASAWASAGTKESKPVEPVKRRTASTIKIDSQIMLQVAGNSLRVETGENYLMTKWKKSLPPKKFRYC